MAKSAAATTPKSEDKEDKKQPPTPAQQASSYFEKNKELHYNFEESQFYRTPCSSLILTSVMGGGLPPGGHRAVGATKGGKTHGSLDFMYHFLRARKNRRGLYVKAEGRLAPEVMLRSGLRFVTDPTEWEDGTCLILESNIYEMIFGFMGDLIRNNPLKTQYFFVLDSMDMISRQEDIEKPLTESQRVAGGALITATFLKQTAIALEKRGHTCIFISQVRDEIKSQYEKRIPRQGGASGGHALEHQGTWVLEYMSRWEKDKIRENDTEAGKVIGHYCKVKILKSTNEIDDTEVRYPVMYGRTNARSVWVEREIGDMLIMWEDVKKTSAKSSWFELSAGLRDDVKEHVRAELPEKVQGMAAIYSLLEGNAELTAYLFDKLAHRAAA